MKQRSWCTANPARAGRRATLLAIGVLLAVAACSNDAPDPPAADEPGAGAPAVPGAPAPPASPEVPTGPADTARWSVGITTVPPTAAVPPLPVLTALRAGTHPEYERVTFEVGAPEPTPGDGPTVGTPDGRPGYELEYVDRPLIACGSGEQIFPVGEGWLEIRLEPAAAHTEEGRPTLGPRQIDVGGPLLRRIYRTCDFEGIVTYVLALESPNEYRVFTLADPLRIVVDVRR